MKTPLEKLHNYILFKSGRPLDDNRYFMTHFLQAFPKDSPSVPIATCAEFKATKEPVYMVGTRTITVSLN